MSTKRFLYEKYGRTDLKGFRYIVYILDNYMYIQQSTTTGGTVGDTVDYLIANGLNKTDLSGGIDANQAMEILRRQIISVSSIRRQHRSLKRPVFLRLFLSVPLLR